MVRGAAGPALIVPGAAEAKEAAGGHAVRLAALIEEHIRAAGLMPGANVGTRSNLAARYGVGPEVFRQAARLLEQRGIARIQRGKFGGLIVMAPQLDASAHALATFFEFANVGLADIGAVDEVLRVLSFEPASRALSLADASDLRRRLDAIAEDGPALWHATILTFDINQEIVDRIGNPVFSLIHQAIMLFLVDVIPLDRIAQLDGTQALRQLLDRTSALVEALIANDLQAAQRFWLNARDTAMQREAEWRQIDRWRERANAKIDLGPIAERWTGRWTLADKVARELLRDIRARGWPEGTGLGTEAELIQSYGVSRATFRQAVRLLEHYSAARMQRGSRGGLVVTSPDPVALIEATVADLWRAEARPQHARPLQIKLQCKAIDLLCAAFPAEAREQLTRRAAALRSLRGSPLRAAVAEIQRTLVELSGNKVLEVCWSLLVAVALPDGIPRAVSDQRILGVVTEVFPALIDSLASNDRARARRALFDYLIAEDAWIGL